MKNIFFFLLTIAFAMASCTKDKTDYEAELETTTPKNQEFKEAIIIQDEHLSVVVETLNGKFYKGYNEIHVEILDLTKGERVEAEAVTIFPLLIQEGRGLTACPHSERFEFDAEKKHYQGFSIFAAESTSNTKGELFINVMIKGQKHVFQKGINIESQENKNLNMTLFTGNDDEKRLIALVSPQYPIVGENKLVAGLYKFEKVTDSHAIELPRAVEYIYTQVNDYLLLLDPRMPEPSMGNHSSPGNKDLLQREDDFYHGVVNYTMTGNWTLNFILQDNKGKIIKGTQVSKEFTPGIKGEKSELFIDVLF